MTEALTGTVVGLQVGRPAPLDWRSGIVCTSAMCSPRAARSFRSASRARPARSSRLAGTRRELPGLMPRSGTSGYYLRALAEGRVASGDELELLERSSAVSVRGVLRVSFRDRGDAHALRAVLAEPLLAEQWREMLRQLSRRKRLPSFTES